MRAKQVSRLTERSPVRRSAHVSRISRILLESEQKNASSPDHLRDHFGRLRRAIRKPVVPSDLAHAPGLTYPPVAAAYQRRITARSSSATAVSSTRTTGSPDPAPFAEIRLMRRRVALGTLTHTLRSADATTDAELMVLSALSVASSLWRRVNSYDPRTFLDGFSGFPIGAQRRSFRPAHRNGGSRLLEIFSPEEIKSGRFLAMRYTLDTRRRARDSPSATRTRTTRCRRS